jgi:hypothetical protein
MLFNSSKLQANGIPESHRKNENGNEFSGLNQNKRVVYVSVVVINQDIFKM